MARKISQAQRRAHLDLVNKPPDLADPFRRPDRARLVFCNHCQQTYSSDLITWRLDYWRCPTPGCNGAGFGWDIKNVNRSDDAQDDADGISVFG